MKIETTRMASGSLSILLQKPAYWKNFANDAKIWIEKLDAKLINKADSVDERIRSIEYKGRTFWISYDDCQASITLEPKDAIQDEVLRWDVGAECA